MLHHTTISPCSNRRERAASHRAMAMAALASNGSLRVRYRRYTAHTRKAEALSRAADAISLEATQEVSQ